MDREQIARNGKAQVTVTVTNTGKRAGDQVVQMYIHHPVSSVVQPVIALKGFERVHLEPGASQKVIFEVGPDELSILDANLQRVVEAGKVDVLIGSSSTETNSVQLTVAQ